MYVSPLQKYQKSTEFLIPRFAFQKLVRQVARHYLGEAVRFKAQALMALQEASEGMLVDLFDSEWGNKGRGSAGSALQRAITVLAICDCHVKAVFAAIPLPQRATWQPSMPSA